MRQYKPFPTYPLPYRFQKVLNHLLDGKAEKEIPDLVALSLQTVRSYIKVMYRRLGVSNRAQLCAKVAVLKATAASPPIIYSGQMEKCDATHA